MTPQQLKAMKLALEALKDLQLCTDDYYDCSHEASKKGDEAINALEEALAENAMREVQRLGQEIEPDDIASILACRDMLDAQPVPPRTEQEPVAILNHAHGVHTFRNVKLKGLPDGEYLVYTTPPQPEQPNEFKPDWDAMAVMVEEQQRMAKRIEDLEAQPQRTEQNFCPRCGKRTKDIHTCTPPQENT